MGLFGFGKNKNSNKKNIKKTGDLNLPEVYDEAELSAVDAHIEKYFGKVDKVFHEIASPDIHVDIYICEPTEERPHYTLVTHGMGAHRMNVPDELDEYKFGRAELLISLPPDWDINSEDEKDFWPIRWLKVLARMPIEHDTWLGYGHTVRSGAPLAENNSFVCIMLILPELFEPDSAICELPNGEVVDFYQLLPLYQDEMDYKLEHDAQSLEERFEGNIPFIVDIGRKSAVADK